VEPQTTPSPSDPATAAPATEAPPKTPETPPRGDGTGDPDLFPRAYVEELRQEAADARVKAKRGDVAVERLVTLYAASTQRLADPTDLPFHEDLLGEDGLPDAAKVAAAVEALLTAKPHLAARRVTGDIGQGARPEHDEPSLSALLRAGAG
jgi:hypothetical protein